MLTAGRNYPGYAMRDLQREAEAEVVMRRRIYENRVLTGRMTRAQADSKIRKMEAIAAHLAELADRERLL
jgi:hypothetical protein